MDGNRLIRSTTNECRLYIGNLPKDVREKDLEDVFYKFGRIAAVDIHNRYNPAFAFVEFEDPRDAKDAVHERDGYDLDGYRIRVEFPRGNSGRDESYGRGYGQSRGRGRGMGPPRRSDYRVLISGLPPTGSWQDLKDHMREAGDVLYTDVFKDGTGVVEFARYDDMKWAIRNLDDTKFRSHEGETSFVRVKADKPGRSRSFSPDRIYGDRSASRSPRRSRSRSRGRRRRSGGRYRSRSRSPKRSRSGRSKSRSPRRSHSRSPRRSKSRSPRRSRSRSRKSHSRSRSRSDRGSYGRSPRRSKSRDKSRSASRSKSRSSSNDRKD
ncbi:serine/arginine-rich splicing factor 1B-like isoform X1 [Rhopilema esculentum]|uniref:serine/arginine-rich splicing factor 1B-like isoform X1 n=1 Tax=Rhopilema esculentum TaxID=499914 RepID=UPI0031D0A18E